ncbi:Hypothetical protein D9617_4g003220 [Elsinoe fawcettii]|nr:Hypothetical protein D9617_4g003220 [Elsinoe fawcettii]
MADFGRDKDPPPPYKGRLDGPSDSNSMRHINRDRKSGNNRLATVTALVQEMIEEQLEKDVYDMTLVLIFPGQGIVELSPGQEIVGHVWDDGTNVLSACIPESGGTAHYWTQAHSIGALRESVDSVLRRYGSERSARGQPANTVELEEVSLREENSFGLYTTRTLRVLAITIHFQV